MFRFLRGLEEMHVPKPVKAELGGGKKEFSLAEGLTAWQWFVIITVYISRRQLYQYRGRPQVPDQRRQTERHPPLPKHREGRERGGGGGHQVQGGGGCQ